MRSVDFMVPSVSRENWAEYWQRYAVNSAETDLLTSAAAAGRRGHLTAGEFLEIARWKSRRPTKWFLQNSDEAVRTVTAAAFAATSDTDKLVGLTHLVGINVRTATAILHLCFPTQYPLLDVRALAALGHAEASAWDELTWLRLWKPYITLCRRLALELGCSLREVDRALFEMGGDVLAAHPSTEPGVHDFLGLTVTASPVTHEQQVDGESGDRGWPHANTIV